jgi:hypothetical protein
MCTQCGGTTHDCRSCLQRPEIALARTDEHPAIKCMSCGQLGHANCKAIFTAPVAVATTADTDSATDGVSKRSNADGNGKSRSKDKDRDGVKDSASAVFCPNCGQAGHHADYPPIGRYNPCRQPRHEAYLKFPQRKSIPAKTGVYLPTMSANALTSVH